MNKKIYLNNSLEEIFNKLNKKENFSLMRYGDGERSLMLGKAVHAQEGWIAPQHITPLGEAIKDSLSLEEDNVIYGISCPCCDRAAYYWYMTHIKNHNITFANIFVNSNYYRFIEEFEKIERDAIVIGNKVGNGNKIGNLNVIKYYSVGDQCVEQWETEGTRIIQNIIEDYGDRDNLLYVFAAGPLSEPMIAALYRNNPNNCYVDFGSSIDRYIHCKDTRPYTDPKSLYGSRNCWMYDPKETCFDVSVVLTTYKKPEALKEQLEAIEKQSLKPKEILLYKDGIDEGYQIRFDNSILEKFDDVKECEYNTGVWNRFDYARSSKSHYVCVFDDDTIPGERWLENCHSNMMEQEGVYGTVGIVLEDYKNYPYSGYYKVGWVEPYTKRTQVDFVGHSWFVKRKYLDYMFENTDKYQRFKRAAEDMGLSYKCQQQGIMTFVPPHPYSDLTLWGSQPKQGHKYGTTNTAISMSNEGNDNMRKAMSLYVEDGWKFVIDYDKNLVMRTKKEIEREKKKKEIKRRIKKLKMKFVHK